MATDKPEGAKVLYTRAEPALVKALENELKKRRRLTPGVKLAQADVIRSLLWEALKKGQTS